MTSGKEQDVAQFSPPLALLWDSFCAAVWLGLCILHFLFVFELGELVCGAPKNPCQGIESVE